MQSDEDTGRERPANTDARASCPPEPKPHRTLNDDLPITTDGGISLVTDSGAPLVGDEE